MAPIPLMVSKQKTKMSKNFEVLPAEEIKVAETSKNPFSIERQAARGGTPPIRRKAWWRAYRGKRLSAIVPYCLEEQIRGSGQFKGVICSRYCPDDQYYVVWSLDV